MKLDLRLADIPHMVWNDSTLVLWAVLGLLAYGLVHSTYAVLTHRLRTQLRRHDILVNVSRRRDEFHSAVSQRRTNPAGKPADDARQRGGESAQVNVDVIEEDQPETSQAGG